MGCFWEISTLPPSPPFLLVTATAPAADYRGRLMLTMQNSIEFIITKGRFLFPPKTTDSTLTVTPKTNTFQYPGWTYRA